MCYAGSGHTLAGLKVGPAKRATRGDFRGFRVIEKALYIITKIEIYRNLMDSLI